MKKFGQGTVAWGLATSAFVLGLSVLGACSDESQVRKVSPSSPIETAEVSGQTSSADEIIAENSEVDKSLPELSDDEVTGDEDGEIYSLTEGRFRCRASGPGGRQADLRLENKSGESRFRAKWEINVGQGQVPGTVVNVAINGTNIGGIVLSADGNQLEGDIEMRGRNLPAAIANVKAGTPVVIGALRCNFARD